MDKDKFHIDDADFFKEIEEYNKKREKLIEEIKEKLDL